MDNIATESITGCLSNPPLIENDKEDRDMQTEYVVSADHMKETFIKHVRQDLSKYHALCFPELMGQTISEEFTGQLVGEICSRPDCPIRTFKRKEKEYIQYVNSLRNSKRSLSLVIIRKRR